MSKYESAIRTAIDAQERQVCLDLLRNSPALTLGEIHKLSRGSIGRHFSSITVGELLGGPVQQDAEALPKSGAPAEDGVAPATVNTRTAAGRQAYDNAMLEALKAEEAPVSAAQLIAKVGGTKLQARMALNRLIDAKKVVWTGKARGTKYSAA